MNDIEKQYYIDKLDDVIKTTKLTKANLEKLVIIKEGIKKESTKKGILKLLGDFWDFFK